MGSWATSAVTPAVAPTVEAISWRITQDEGASSVKLQVRHAKSNLFSDLSSRGNRRLELPLVSGFHHVAGRQGSPFRAEAEENGLFAAFDTARLGCWGRHIGGGGC